MQRVYWGVCPTVCFFDDSLSLSLFSFSSHVCMMLMNHSSRMYFCRLLDVSKKLPTNYTVPSRNRNLPNPYSAKPFHPGCREASWVKLATWSCCCSNPSQHVAGLPGLPGLTAFIAEKSFTTPVAPRMTLTLDTAVPENGFGLGVCLQS